MTSAERILYSKEFTRVNRAFEKKYYPKVKTAIRSKVTSVISYLRRYGLSHTIEHLHKDISNPALYDVVRKMYLEVGLRHARKESKRQREDKIKYGFKKSHKQLVLVKADVSTPANFQTKGFGFNAQWTAFILNYLQEFLTSKITFSVSATTRDKLLDVLQRAISDGWSIDRTVEHLDHLPFTENQAARIVRTEVNRAANVGTMAGVDTADYVMNKEWISAHDHRTRGTNPEDHANHVELDGNVIGFEEKFKDKRNGDLLSFPGDPEASAASTVNCRCSVSPVPARNSSGQLIPRAQPAVYVPMIGMRRPSIAAQPFSLTVGQA